ncbi:MAG: leucine-rich repeat domain-containing protein [Ruminococcus sp.]|nr:leucine-rich repeat domain-containing protein [Ruminococcus sp.]
MNENEILARIENLENEVESLKMIVKMLSKDSDFSTVNVPVTPEKQPEESYDPNDFDIENGVLVEYTGKSEEVTIPYGVTIIGNGAFSQNKTIQKVNFPDTVTEIGEKSFYRCSKLVEVNISVNCIKMGSSAFASCHNLEKIDINNIKRIPRFAFDLCRNLKRLIVSENTEIIENFAFRGCENLRISVPETCNYDRCSFSYCKIVEIREVKK